MTYQCCKCMADIAYTSLECRNCHAFQDIKLCKIKERLKQLFAPVLHMCIECQQPCDDFSGAQCDSCRRVIYCSTNCRSLHAGRHNFQCSAKQFDDFQAPDVFVWFYIHGEFSTTSAELTEKEQKTLHTVLLEMNHACMSRFGVDITRAMKKTFESFPKSMITALTTGDHIRFLPSQDPYIEYTVEKDIAARAWATIP